MGIYHYDTMVAQNTVTVLTKDIEQNMLIDSIKKAKTVASWTAFIVVMIVYYFSVERVGSLWDVGEFILGAYKLEVVHPPGAPLFMLIGRMFAWVGDLVSSNPATIAFMVNMLSAICTALGAFLIARITIMLGQFAFVGRSEETTATQNVALTFAGIVAGLSMAFCSSIWFSAVEGEVYAMSTFFTILTLWTTMKWYSLPDSPRTDKWLVLCAYMAGLSIGVHLLSLLTFPALGALYYFKKFKKHNPFGLILSFIAGASIIVFIQKFVIVGIPTLWKSLEKPLVNEMGMPFHSGLVLALLLIGLFIAFLLRLAHKKRWYHFQLLVVAGLMVAIGFSTIGVIVIRANADTPVNMNVPSDAMRVLPYLNREQYGERALLYGPHFKASPVELDQEDRYGRVGDKYVKVDQKLDYVYNDRDKMFLPRIGHTEGSRPELHKQWHRQIMGKEVGSRPGFGYNMKYMFKYQMGWMYWRYFFWNFVGRQNAQQGFTPWDVSSGHWISGFGFLDEARLHNMDAATDSMKRHKGTNKYYFLPLLLGLLGLFFHLRKRPKEFTAIMILFLITGLGLIMYSNQPPNEPRERDYVLVGSFFTYCIWIGLGVLGLFSFFKDKVKLGAMSPLVAGGLGLLIPAIMAFQNFDDHSRLGHYGSRDYASNFLNSVDENAIIFTYGDNDTYPLWYAQEVENIRRDVRVVNLSLIAVDWYIEKLRRKVNDSAPLKLSIPTEAYRGNKRNQVFFYNPESGTDDPRLMDLSTPRDLRQELAFIGSQKQDQVILRSRNLYIPIDRNRMIGNGLMSIRDTSMTNKIDIRIPESARYILKDQLAVMDLVASNIHDRAIYFAVTCKNDKLLAMNDYMQMEGLGLRLIPVRSRSVRELSIYGSGRVAEEKVYDNVMNKWKWGNFDTHETFIDESYAAELQAMKIVMMRTCQELAIKGKMKKAAEMSKKFFDAFPHYNFPYDDSVMPFIEVLNEAGENEEARKHMEILAEELYQRMVFYDSLDASDRESFRQFYGFAVRGVQDVIDKVGNMGDADFAKRTREMLAPYDANVMKK